MTLAYIVKKEMAHNKLKNYEPESRHTKSSYLLDMMNKRNTTHRQYIHPQPKRTNHRIEALKLIHKQKRRMRDVTKVDEFEKNISKYMQIEAELLQDPQYRGKYVVIHKGEIVDFGDNKQQLLKKAYDELGYVSLIVHKVGTRKVIHHYTPFRR